MADDTKPTGVTPYLTIGGDGAAAAADFYIKAFGATEVTRMPADDGKRLMHCHLKINGDDVMLSDAFPEHGYAAQPPAAFTLHLQVDDARAWADKAVAAGATLTMPVEKQFWGDIYGQFRDPFGVMWSVGSAA